MRRWLLLGLVTGMLLAVSAPPTLAQLPDPTGYRVSLAFEHIKQGGVGLVRVQGLDVAGARARFLNRLIEFYPRHGEWYGLLAVGMEQSPNTYPLEVHLWFEDGSRRTWQGEVEVVSGEFIRQDVTVDAALGYLLEPQVDRAERVRLMGLFNQVTPIHYWSGPFAAPTEGEFTSPFGAWRLYNQVFWGRHTGVDMRGPVGTPLLASAAGRVVLAERLDVRGNYVLIDHGWGVYTGYAHLTEIHVAPGQVVRQGQVIGVSGNTGRSNGPHIHWELAVDGEWVDPVQFLEVSPP